MTGTRTGAGARTADGTGTALVVGASGFLGGAVVSRLRADGWTVVGTYCSTPTPAPDETVEFDFWTDDPVSLVDRYDADAVVFAAAVEYGGEADTGNADADAAFGERADRFAAACADRRFVYVSSAAVYDGEAGGYDESDPRSPRDDYGRRLVRFEDAVDAACDDAAVFRTSYLFGFSGGELDSRLARTRDQVRRGEQVAYFTDMYKSPLAVSEAADAIETLLAGEATGVVHAPSPRTSVYDFHCDAMRALGYDPGPIEGEAIPPDMDVAPDRSLTSERFVDVVGFEPSAVEPAMREMAAETTE